ncbi:MAG: hypothetical protein WC745_04465 [Patescibacteria group bacterium]|jgi:hypothetical protein
MNFSTIFSKKSKTTSFNDLSSREKKKIMRGAIEKANKEQYDMVKAYRETKCHAQN